MAEPATTSPFQPPTPAEIKAQVIDLTDGIDQVKPVGGAPYVAGFFDDEASFVTAAKAVRAAGRTDLQAWTPYPVHGLDPVLGLKRSLIGRPVFTVALIGFAACFMMQFHFMVEDWPTNYGGKPYYGWPLWVVPTLETGLLFAAVVNLLLAFKSCRLLPDPATRMPDPRLSDDRFAIALGHDFPETEQEALLRSVGAKDLTRFGASDVLAEPVFAPWREPVPALQTMDRDAVKDAAHHA